MHFSFLCLVACALFGSMLYMVINPYNQESLYHFINTLNTNQQGVFLAIHQERFRIYIISLLLGLIAGALFLLLVPEHGAVRICGFVVVVLALTHIIYILWPKSAYMLTHLTTHQQRRAWLNVYKTMQRSHYLGIVLGALAYCIVAYVPPSTN
jgi:hypothetical protein